MTDLVPERITPDQLQECYRLLSEHGKDESLAWMTAHVLHDALQEEWIRVNDVVAVLEAERACHRDLETGLAHQRQMKLDCQARAEALIEAARDLCNQETDTYPALQKALADVDAGRGGRRVSDLEVVADATREIVREYDAAAVGTSMERVGDAVDAADAALARLDANKDTE